MGLLTYLAVTVLGIIGFAVTGPVAGSLAAGIQAAYYGGAVATGSWFAIAQSIAMTAPTPWFIYHLFVAIIPKTISSSINITKIVIKKTWRK